MIHAHETRGTVTEQDVLNDIQRVLNNQVILEQKQLEIIQKVEATQHAVETLHEQLAAAVGVGYSGNIMSKLNDIQSKV